MAEIYWNDSKKTSFPDSNFKFSWLGLFHCIKGQLISKGNFSVFNSPKNELENVNFCASLLEQNFFVRFLGELKKPKSPFEINCPLVCSNQ